MKFFKKYYLVLPPVALIYGIFIWQMHYDDSLTQTMMDSFVNGWQLLWIIFAALAAGIIYQLQQNKKQQYIYSLPWTKKEIYKKSFLGLWISLVISELIYGIFFTAKLVVMLDADPFGSIILSTLLNACFCFSLCAVTQLSLIVTSYVWQGLIIALAAIYVMIPMILQNVTYVIQMAFKIGGNIAFLLSWIIYASDRNILYPLYYREEVVINGGGAFTFNFNKQYMIGMIICMAALLLAAAICLWFAKKQYTKQNLAQNRMLTRMSQTANKNIMTVMIAILVFNTWSNNMMARAVLGYYDGRTLTKAFYEILAWNKSVLADTSNLKKLFEVLNGTEILAGFVVIFVVTYLVISLIQTIRRKRYERAR